MSKGDEDDGPRSRYHWGDMGALVLAGSFSLLGLYLTVDMALGGHPLAILFKEQPKEAPAPLTKEEIRNLPFHADKGEVVIMTDAPPPAFAAGNSVPPIKEWSSLRIRLERTMCLGSCPAYSVEISGDGSVVYNGSYCVAEKGERRASISQAEVVELVQKFRDADYFALHDRYAGQITDQPRQITSLRFDGHAKTVEDYVGRSAGMPRVVTALEEAIDKAAGTERWIGDGGQPCRGKSP